MSVSFHFITLLVALLLDAIMGDPDWLWRKLPHPVVVMGKLIDWLDQGFNKSTQSRNERQKKGLLALLFLVSLAAFTGVVLQWLVNSLAFTWVFEAIVVAIFLSARSLYDHVARVAGSLETSGLPQARIAVSQIVGRDPKMLDRSGVCRAAIESLAENFSDGVVAPVVWYLVAGLPGLMVYKAVNTADSMIGHKTGRHRDFGRAAARLDDFLNLPASRLTALLCVLGAGVHNGAASSLRAVSVIRRDAGKHRSPNAGWPEAAMAGALNIALSGPRSYHGKPSNDEWVNEAGRRHLTQGDIRAGLSIYTASLLIFAGLVGVLAIVF